MNKDEINLVVNAERLLIVSGHKFYFEKQRGKMINEIDRLNTIYKTTRIKKKEWKLKYIKKEDELNKTVIKFNKEIDFYKIKVKLI